MIMIQFSNYMSIIQICIPLEQRGGSLLEVHQDVDYAEAYKPP